MEGITRARAVGGMDRRNQKEIDYMISYNKYVPPWLPLQDHSSVDELYFFGWYLVKDEQRLLSIDRAYWVSLSITGARLKNCYHPYPTYDRDDKNWIHPPGWIAKAHFKFPNLVTGMLNTSQCRLVGLRKIPTIPERFQKSHASWERFLAVEKQVNE